MGTKPRKPATPPEPSSPANDGELPERWSVQRKSELVLRLLRGEALGMRSGPALAFHLPPPRYRKFDYFSAIVAVSSFARRSCRSTPFPQLPPNVEVTL